MVHHRRLLGHGDAGLAGDVRRALSGGAFSLPNDPAKIARAMIGSLDLESAPLRPPPGIDTYHDVRASLAARLAEPDARRDVALSVADDHRAATP